MNLKPDTDNKNLLHVIIEKIKNYSLFDFIVNTI